MKINKHDAGRRTAPNPSGGLGGAALPVALGFGIPVSLGVGLLMGLGLGFYRLQEFTGPAPRRHIMGFGLGLGLGNLREFVKLT